MLCHPATSLSCLQALLLSFNPHETAQIVIGLKKCPRLTCMYLPNLGMREQAGQALLDGLRDNAWPHLNELDVSDNPDLGDEILVDGLIEVLEGGACSKLEEMIASRTTLTGEGKRGCLKCCERDDVFY